MSDPTWPERLAELGYKPDGRRISIDPDKHLLHSWGDVPAMWYSPRQFLLVRIPRLGFRLCAERGWTAKR